MVVFALVVLWLALACLALGWLFRENIVRGWREPVLRNPVMILESDDWGYGPVDQSMMLDRLAETLDRYRDARGRPPVMTLGVVLAGPATDAMRAEDCARYHRLTLADDPLRPVRDSMLRGKARGLFALHLHGHEHYWPECVMRAARERPEIHNWLCATGMPRTEDLPSPLQSRWIDAAALPSRSLPADAARREAGAEVRAFATTFGEPPAVVVPPTFVWTREVESAWADAGIGIVMTPGRRSEARDAEGKLVYEPGEICNGDLGEGGCLYLVRDVYFEPALGHDHQRATADVVAKSKLGRPALVEIHRMNFLPSGPSADQAIDELCRLISSVRALLPDVRFMSPAELAEHYAKTAGLVETRPARRAHYLLRRLAVVSKLRKLAWITGAIIPATIAYAVTRPARN